jgi:cyclase
LLLAKRIIPCLDVDRGRVVKGINFLNLRDAGDPVEVARRYEEDGADELVFLDISASHEGRAIMLDVVRRVSEEIFMPFTVGGGIRTLDDATRLIQAGAEKVSINSAAVRDPDLVSQVAGKFGSCATVVNIDPRRVKKDDGVLWRCTSMAAGCRRASKRSRGLGASRNSGQGRSCSPRWTPTARKRATIWK